MDGEQIAGLRGLGSVFAVARLHVFHGGSSSDLSNLYCLNAQAQRGLVCNTGDHRDAVISHLIEEGVIVACNGHDGLDLIDFSALVGLVGHGVADLHILQLPEVCVAAAVMAKQTDIPVIESGACIMADTLRHRCVACAFIHFGAEADALDGYGANTAILLHQIGDGQCRAVRQLNCAAGYAAGTGIVHVRIRARAGAAAKTILNASAEVGIIQ